MLGRCRAALLALGAFFTSLQVAHAQNSSTGPRYVEYTTPSGQVEYLLDDRRPALYTQNWGDCLEDNAINLTRFDAAYYVDNQTVLFHLAGNSQIANDSLMMYISVYAYGKTYFELVFNPCSANIVSLCPVNKSIPITASGIIPVSPSDVADVPSIAYSIPDFEGEAILRIFSNTTQQEISCYSGVITNGGSFSQPATVGSFLGVFAFIALVASFATAIYGEAIPTMRLHYAHSMSVAVVFSVYQHIYFTGALSLDWPSVLPAWQSNFAWAGGMIYTSSMQQSINNLIGASVGNTTEVGAADAGATQYSLGGGYDISLIYRRMLALGKRIVDHPLARDMASDIYRRDHVATPLRRDALQRLVQRALFKRDDLANKTNGYDWYGDKVDPGLPLPGNWSGFAGTLADENIPVSHAFMTGFLWFLICLAAMVGTVVIFKWLLEALIAMKIVKRDRLTFFRERWLGFTGLVALRTCYIAFFMIILLTTFQFSYDSSSGVKAIAAIVFVIFLVGIPAVVVYAAIYKLTVHDVQASGTSPPPKETKRSWFTFGKKKQDSPAADDEAAVEKISDETKAPSAPFWKRTTSTGSMIIAEPIPSIHDDEDYIKKFGWLAARFRRTRWWFFIFWTFYVFLEAIFYGGASSNALVQVFGLLVIELLAGAFMIWARPFEGQRLNVIVVWCLSISKIATLALSACFYVGFDLNRIIAAALGIIIIVIQGFLVVATWIAILLGAASSYASISRNKEQFHPKRYAGLREKYFDHLDRTADDLPPAPKPVKEPEPEPVYGFEISNVRRVPKVEDEDAHFVNEMRNDGAASIRLSVHSDRTQSPGIRSGAASPVMRSRAPSMTSLSQSNLPYGARPNRPSWSMQDFERAGAFSQIDLSRGVPDDDGASQDLAARRTHSRASSRNGISANTRLLQTRSSADSLRIGGDVSTRDTIGKVPTPMTRARTGTVTSARSSRALSIASTISDINNAASSSRHYNPNNPTNLSTNRYSYHDGEQYYDAASSQHLQSTSSLHVSSADRSSNRASGAFSPRGYPLTPAQEFEEWVSPQGPPASLRPPQE